MRGSGSRPLPLLAGKVLGLAAAGLLQVAAYIAFIVGAAPVALMLRIGAEAVSPAELGGARAVTPATAAAALYVSASLVRRVTIAGAR